MAAAAGLVTRDLVNGGQPGEQGFFGGEGLTVEYDDVLIVNDLPHEAHPRNSSSRGASSRGTTSLRGTSS